MMMHRAVLPAETAPLLPEAAVWRRPVHAAILSPRAPRIMAALAAREISSVDATDCDLALLRRDAPDMLILDLEPGTFSPRRIALLVAQLGWARRDMVIAASRGSAALAQGFAVDLIFDADADAETLAETLAEGRQVLAHSRLRHVAPEPARTALLRRPDAPRRASLFN
ncbi:hypothetical protein C0V75_14465 [Tabrizicola sp. TH137]|uniref:hypothetical protein n=1 Tax=Tabrizicola sp. TH137 TaxID=2067452 RepID=UPI000C7CE498|nr:hypothetical protein [Tabrizicola sp. TH137]PLL12083.1 hypothetical protein C0V75_14465 [Tabrizicola sp. TH137]